MPPQSDLSERCLLFEPLKIKPSHRQTDSDFWKKFQVDKPAILGGMFQALGDAMDILPNLQTSNLHRMADAHRDMTAIAMALGIDQAELDRIFWANVNRLKTANTANAPFVEAMLNYLEHRSNENTLTTSMLLDAVRKDFTNRSCNAYLAYTPKDVARFGRRLNEIKDTLFEAGYNFDSNRKSDATYITIKQIAPSRLNKKQKQAAERRTALFTDDDAASDD